MPIYSYLCLEHGEHDVFMRELSPPKTQKCPKCNGDTTNIIASPAIIDVKRGWDEQANDYRRNPYEQAKAQLKNVDRENQERGKSPIKITEKMVQETAKQIDNSKFTEPNRIENKTKRELLNRAKKRKKDK